jgi:hypothetical protein
VRHPDAQPPPGDEADGGSKDLQGDEPKARIADGWAMPADLEGCVLCRLADWLAAEMADAEWCRDWPRFVTAGALLAVVEEWPA